MSKFRKGLAAIAAVTMLSAMSMSAYANPVESFPLGDQTLYGYCSLGTNSASATTTFTTAAYITVEVRYDYNWGLNSQYYQQVTAYNSNGGTSVSATAYAQSGHSYVISVRAKGTHYVYYQGGSKTLNTEA